MDELDDATLWQQVKNGDDLAFEEIWRCHNRRVFQALCQRRLNPSEADEGTSEVFLRAWKRRERSSPRDSAAKRIWTEN